MSAPRKAKALPDDLHCIDGRTGEPLSKLLQSGEPVDAVFVDFFDTVVTRTINPEYLKVLWAKSMRYLFGLQAHPSSLYEIRRRIEVKLCEESQREGLDAEFRYDDMCAEFFTELLARGEVLHTTPSDFAATALETELNLEKRVQQPIEETVTLLRELKQSGTRLFLLSDFYLSRESFEELLRHHGLEEIFEALYISNETRNAKRSGRLYDIVLSVQKLSPGRVVMIGDNPYADRDEAERRGIRSLWLDRSASHKKASEYWTEAFRPDKPRELIQQLQVEASRKLEIFPEFPLSLFCFIDKLYRTLRWRNASHAVFLAREGELLRKLFDIYQESMGYGDTIKSHYAIVSRRSTFLPSLRPLFEEKFETLFRQYRKISVREFLLSLNLPTDSVAQLEKTTPIDFDTRQEDLPSSKAFKELMKSDVFRQIYAKEVREQQEYFRQYILTSTGEPQPEKLHFVDVGWKGSIQDNIRRVIPGTTDLVGFYLGLIQAHQCSDSNMKYGLLYSCFAPSAPSAVHLENTALYEILLAASHGSALRYRSDNGRIVAETEEIEYEQQLFRQVISPIQDKIIEVFKEICERTALTHLTFENFEPEVARTHARMVLFPTREEVKFIQRVRHYENFGLFEFTTFENSTVVPFGERLKNLRKFIGHPMKTARSTLWSSITFEQMGLPWLRFPYGALLYYRTFLKNENALLRPFGAVVSQIARGSRAVLRRFEALL